MTAIPSNVVMHDREWQIDASEQWELSRVAGADSTAIGSQGRAHATSPRRIASHRALCMGHGQQHRKASAAQLRQRLRRRRNDPQREKTSSNTSRLTPLPPRHRSPQGGRRAPPPPRADLVGCGPWWLSGIWVVGCKGWASDCDCDGGATVARRTRRMEGR